MSSKLTQLNNFLKDRLTPKLPDLSHNYNDGVFYARDEGGQIVIISDVRKEEVLENCL